MEPARYQRLVRTLEALAQSSPRSLKLRVRMLVALGYAYVFSVLGLLIVAVILAVWVLIKASGGGLVVKLVLPLLALIVVIAKSLRVRVAPPEGRPLEKGRAPVLDERVAQIRSELSAPKADHVVLTDAFNAAVMQVPRWGIFGFPRTYLVLGVPLMLCLTRDQFDAVLAHEFAHLSGAHPKLGLWVHRMSRTWNQLLEQLATKRSWGRHLFVWFIRWYQPRLEAYGFVLSRRDEYEADADAARVTSAESMGGALVGLEVGGRTLRECFWQPIWRTAADAPTPPQAVWSTMGAVWRAPLAPELRMEWLGTALAHRAADDDTHPSLRERLTALGLVERDASRVDQLPTLATVAAPSAAEHYLGDLAKEILTGFDLAWRTNVSDRWRERHEEVKQQRAMLAELAEQERQGPLGAAGFWQRANAYNDLGETEESIRAFRALVALEPSHVRGHFLLGALLLGENDESGVEHVKQSMSLSSEFAVRGAVTLRDYYAGRGMEEEKRAMVELLWRNSEELRLALEERQALTKRDQLAPLLLNPAYLEQVRAAMADDERVLRLWIAQKVTTHLPDYPMLVVLVEPKWWRGTFSGPTAGLAQDVMNRVDAGAWVHLYVMQLSGTTEWVMKRMAGIEGSLVYERR
jgi:Zn-dependent protease with chaperone function